MGRTETLLSLGSGGGPPPRWVGCVRVFGGGMVTDTLLAKKSMGPDLFVVEKMRRFLSIHP